MYLITLSKNDQSFSKVKNSSTEKNNEPKFIQPNMRYKPRTDLERVFEAVSKYNYGQNRDIISNQLKQLYLGGPQQNKKVNSEESFNALNKSNQSITNTNRDDSSKLTYQDDTSLITKRIKRRIVDNSEAKTILKDLYIKTHFKAASVYTILKSIIK